MKLSIFKEIDFLNAVKALFTELKVPVNYVADEPTTAKEILKDTYKDNATFNLVDDVYFVGMVDDAAFEGNQGLSMDKIKSDYDGILIFGITLYQRENNLLPTRSQLAEISRAFNREFYYTPVVLVFKYQDDISEYLAFANTERLKYKQEWREGEKAGKVSLLRDINIEKPHRGHEDIINQLKIPTSGTKQVDSFAKLYAYWQEVFSVSILNKKFYQELQNWYFWAIKEVSFPNQPKILDENIDGDEAKLKEAIKEHKGKNVIRLLTRILFIWFIKEKKLIPEEIFDEQTIADKLIDDFTPQKPHGVFATGKHNSKYYRAILQNLFFATLNQEMGKRTFRNDKQHQNVTNLMRYESYFKDPDYFVQLVEDVVPFMNGGLFECLDKPHPEKKGRQGGDIIIYTDGFSDRADNFLTVPDYLFFDVDEDVDLSDDFGSTSKVYKNAKTRGLLEILKSYKFTITENTPIEEDVALDPELLGKVFENLLASYNPETKTTARKQTGSFYTPREIVNYMVDESLIAYLKNAVKENVFNEEELDKKLHQLTSFDNINPFTDYSEVSKQIVYALDRAKILDPAAGSGAFPMGVLQKMVHILQKLDATNELWKEVQLEKALAETKDAYDIDDKKEREQKLIEINNAFDEHINDPDFARKLYLIENCIYGVDIQPIATQISKLRFFISLVVDQKVQTDEPNFGIRPLPNLETKFVTANTLIGIQKENSLFYTDEVKNLEAELKKIRHKLFSARTKETKLKYRQKDEELRNKITEVLKEQGLPLDDAEKLAKWNPYDQNASSPFFDPEWMFDIKDGFDVVIGNPPYLDHRKIDNITKNGISKFQTYYKSTKPNLYLFFIEQGIRILNNNGILIFINPAYYLSIDSGFGCRRFITESHKIDFIVDVSHIRVFEDASTYTVVNQFRNTKKKNYRIRINKCIDFKDLGLTSFSVQSNTIISDIYKRILISNESVLLNRIEEKHKMFDSIGVFNWGTSQTGYGKLKIQSDVFSQLSDKIKVKYKPIVQTSDIKSYHIDWKGEYIPVKIFSKRIIIEFEKDKILIARVTKSIQCSFDDSKNNYVGKSTLITNFSVPFEIIIGVINSKVVNFWYSHKFETTHMAGGYLRFDIPYLKQIPFPHVEESNPIRILVNLFIMKLSNQILRNIIDSLVFELYFPDHMKERGIDVLEFVEQDINKVLQSREFEQLSDSEKEQLIEQLHQKWTDPDNEVVKRMGMFKEKSPDILKVILES